MGNYDIHSLELAQTGLHRIEWAFSEMPVLQLLLRRFSDERPLAGIRIGACLHVTTETANLLRVLQAGGAEIALCASNPLSTQDDVAAALVQEFDIPAFAICGEDNDTYYRHIHAVLETRPQITMDDGADLITMPRELDNEVARLKLEAMAVQIDSLSEEQQRYLSSWQEGT